MEKDVWYKLMKAYNDATRFRFPIDSNRIGVNNGIYILFEGGERIGEFDRVTRIGINREQGNFAKRLKDHFEREVQRSSVFRKHLGRCLLNKASDDYLQYWNCDFKSVVDREKYKGKVDLLYESKIEKEISAYIRQNVSFAVIEVNDLAERKKMEDLLIATIASCGKNKPSISWIGLHHPSYPFFAETGLWNVQGLKGSVADEKDFKSIIDRLK